MRNSGFITLVFFIGIASQGIAQLIVFPLAQSAPATKSPKTSARTKEVTPLTLPFWDDFSFSEIKYYPSEKLWQQSKSVWVNDGIGINAPSLKVATFDGLDSNGKPYSINDVLAKGKADSLVSNPIQLDLVSVAQRGTVYLSFYYQFRGNGEPPYRGSTKSLF